jgi:hypothetical protein
MKTSSHFVRQKLARIAAGGPPRVVDLFAGCGGLSLGFATKSMPTARARAIAIGSTGNVMTPRSRMTRLAASDAVHARSDPG